MSSAATRLSLEPDQSKGADEHLVKRSERRVAAPRRGGCGGREAEERLAQRLAAAGGEAAARPSIVSIFAELSRQPQVCQACKLSPCM